MTPAELIDMMKPNTPGILKLIEMKEFNRRANFYGYKNRKKYDIPK